MEPRLADFDKHHQIELAAYHLWQQRGCPFGEPDVDWFRAESELSSHTVTMVEAVAEMVGSVLGSVAGVAAAVGRLVQSAE